MQVIVHAGLHKTGSSSLQEHLRRSRAAMAALGVIYPDFGGSNHWRVVADLIARGGDGDRRSAGYLERLSVDRGADGTLEALADILRENRDSDRIILLSHENFGVERRLTDLAAFVRSIVADVDVTAIAYCRDPVALYPSIVQHDIRAGKPCARIADWTSPHVKRAMRLRTVFGDRVTLRCFSPHTLVDGDIVRDFIRWFARTTGRTLPEPRGVLAFNSALSAEGCALMLATARTRDLEPSDLPNLGKEVSAFDASYAKRRKLALPPRWARAIAETNRADWNDVVALFDHDAETRAEICIASPAREVPTAGPRATERWILSHASQPYADAFASWRQARTGP